MTIIGAAKSGLAVARLLKKDGDKVFVTESADARFKTAEERMLKEMEVEYEFGGHSDRALDADLAVISPGVPATIPMVEKLRALNIPVHSEIEIASRKLKGTIIAVTGSNGKTTTTTWIGEMCKMSGRPWIMAGNIGTPLSDVAETSTDDTLAVLEISSFQAEGLTNFSPGIGVLMNLSADHMDRYESVEAYFRAKRRLFERQTSKDMLIYNADDAEVVKLIKGLSSQAVPFSLDPMAKEGAYREGDSLFLRRQTTVDEIIKITELGIPGEHNQYNALAATLAAVSAGVSLDSIRPVLKQFRGVEHRLEKVRTLRGVTYYNDSKATNVESTMVALRSFKNHPSPVVLIMGGKHKGAPYAPLTTAVRDKVKAIVALGESAPLIAADLGAATQISIATSMDNAVEQAAGMATEGDIVLLSPACSSFDMFKNYEDRGRRFKQAVMELK